MPKKCADFLVFSEIKNKTALGFTSNDGSPFLFCGSVDKFFGVCFNINSSPFAIWYSAFLHHLFFASR